MIRRTKFFLGCLLLVRGGRSWFGRGSRSGGEARPNNRPPEQRTIYSPRTTSPLRTTWKKKERHKRRTFKKVINLIRRHPESNWGSGICNPLPYHLAMPPWNFIFLYFLTFFKTKVKFREVLFIRLFVLENFEMTPYSLNPDSIFFILNYFFKRILNREILTLVNPLSLTN